VHLSDNSKESPKHDYLNSLEIRNPVYNKKKAWLRVVGGEKVTDPAQLPFLVRIVYQPGNSQPQVICTGSIIAPDEILLAAHCLTSENSTVSTSDLYIVAGCLTPLMNMGPKAETFKDTCVASDVLSFSLHPRYDP
jgi:hypothetical protein